jgi:DNA-binding CsgD family transcriptional regulator
MTDAVFHNIYLAPGTVKHSQSLTTPVAVVPGPANTLVLHRAHGQGWAFAGPIEHVWWAGDLALVQARHALYLLRADSIPHPAITAYELAILRGLAAGLTTRAIAKQIYLAESTTHNTITRLLAKFGANHRTQMIAIAKDQGLI